MEQFLVYVFGKNNFLTMKDLQFVLNRENKKPEEQTQVKDIQKNVSLYLAGSALSSVFANLMIQKLSPSFSQATIGKLILDLGLASLFIGGGLFLSLRSVQPHLNKLKKIYLEEKDKEFLKFMRTQGQSYNISLEEQIKRFLNRQQYDLWDAGQGMALLKLQAI